MGRTSKTQTEKAPATQSVKPLMGYVLVEPSEAETKTLSGIILPESVQEKPAGMGKVISLGADLMMGDGKVMACPVSVGDKVYFKKWGGDEIKINGHELKLVKFDDLIAIVEG
ncbi:MAG: co-chaperone GroES [Microgenomates group bacterium]|jgi:chaperonin GroES